ncbi:pentapeptide repeat-containing protein [Kineococcus sp. SYSU DK006]|uniref:pentapeptide repeat-containing protein n=1 Tax=Kineococcus sp. SYSU DK006 TaxID=3383127 RepID=UPI003D7D2A2C
MTDAGSESAKQPPSWLSPFGRPGRWFSVTPLRRTWAAILLILLALGLLTLALWVVPEVLNRRDFKDAAERATAVNAARVPVAGLFLAVVGGLTAWAGHRSVQQARRAMEEAGRQHQEKLEADKLAAARTADLTRQAQYTDRYIKAVQLISDEQISARVGGLYALEQLARDVPLSYYVTVMDVVAAYVRDRAPWPPRRDQSATPTAPRPVRSRVAQGSSRQGTLTATPRIQPPVDVQTALTILGRRDIDFEEDAELKVAVDLARTDLRGAYLREARLPKAFLEGAHLEDADLEGADLRDAELDGAHLEGAYMPGVVLQGALLQRAHLQGADLMGAQARGASFAQAHLEGADLGVAYLQGANLEGARLQGANFTATRLQGARLKAADMTGALTLTQGQLDTVRVSRDTRIPDGLVLPLVAAEEPSSTSNG